MKDKLGNIKEEHMKVFENDKTYSIGDIGIKPFSIPHDSVDAVGYNLFSNKEKMSIATDIGCITENIRQNLFDSKLMGSYTYSLKRRVMSDCGHLSNEEAAKFCVELINNNTESILLAHLSKENNFPDLAFATSKNVLANNDMIIGRDLNLEVLSRDKVSKVFEL